MPIITACGRVEDVKDPARAAALAALVPPQVLDTLLRFVLDDGRGSVVLSVKDRRIIGVRIDAIVM